MNNSIQPTLDQILTNLENAVQRDIGLRQTQHRSGKAPKQTHFEAKQAIRIALYELINGKPGDVVYANTKHIADWGDGYNQAKAELRTAIDRFCGIDKEKNR